MFRKYYKEAMDDIKPDEAFVESVIKNAKKRRPPLYARYTKYAAAAAAAVVIVSGTVLSMPLWQKVTKDTDGVIIEETVTDSAASGSAPTAAPTGSVPTAAPTSAPTVTERPQSTKSQGAGESNTGSTQKTDRAEREPSYSVSEQPGEASEAQEQTTEAAQTDTEAENSAATEAPVLKKAILGDEDNEVRVMSEPMDMAPYGAQADAGEAAGASMAAIEDTDIPTPSGYRCTSATPRGYTFVNDEGAVITVMINYGGEEREPYIEDDGENIYAVFTSFGLSVTINASGAERSAVEEIINSLR